MSLTLTTDDLRRLESLAGLLARPLDAPHADGWRARVVAEMKALLGADTGGFHLPVKEGPEFFSDDFSPGELESRPYVASPVVGRLIRGLSEPIPRMRRPRSSADYSLA